MEFKSIIYTDQLEEYYCNTTPHFFIQDNKEVEFCIVYDFQENEIYLSKRHIVKIEHYNNK